MAVSSPEFATLTTDDLVTGEAVALDLPPASVGLRIASGLIDVAVTVALLFLVLLVSTVAAIGTDAALATVALIGSIILVFVVVPTTLETLTRGRTLGKLALGLRTVRDDAGPISFQHAFIRALIGFVEIYAFGGAPAFFSALLSTRGKRLRDFAPRTYRLPARGAAGRFALPPGGGGPGGRAVPRRPPAHRPRPPREDGRPPRRRGAP